MDGPCAKLSKNYQWIWARWPDLPLAIDVPLFTFRNSKQGTGPCSGASLPPPGCPWQDKNCSSEAPCLYGDACLAGVCAEPTVYNAPGEIADMVSRLPKPRKLIVEFYATGHVGYGTPSPRYVYELLNIILQQPGVAGASVYTNKFPCADCLTHWALGGSCTERVTEACKNWSGSCASLGEPPLFGGDEGCIVAQVFGGHIAAKTDDTGWSFDQWKFAAGSGMAPSARWQAKADETLRHSRHRELEQRVLGPRDRASGKKWTRPAWCPEDAVRRIDETGLLSVKLLGAVGDGLTDDSDAVRVAMNVTAGCGGCVFFPPGDCKDCDAFSICQSCPSR